MSIDNRHVFTAAVTALLCGTSLAIAACTPGDHANQERHAEETPASTSAPATPSPSTTTSSSTPSDASDAGGSTSTPSGASDAGGSTSTPVAAEETFVLGDRPPVVASQSITVEVPQGLADAAAGTDQEPLITAVTLTPYELPESAQGCAVRMHFTFTEAGIARFDDRTSTETPPPGMSTTLTPTERLVETINFQGGSLREGAPTGDEGYYLVDGDPVVVQGCASNVLGGSHVFLPSVGEENGLHDTFARIRVAAGDTHVIAVTESAIPGYARTGDTWKES